VPDQAPTLNNLAVIMWRQNQQVAAAGMYDQAMMAAPVNKFILDNVADALGSLEEDQRKSPIVAKALRRFTEQDLLLQQQQGQQGLYRWGSTWVDQRKLEELKAAEREVRTKLDALQQEFAQVKTRNVTLDSQITTNSLSMQELVMRSYAIDKDGKRIQYPLPAHYYELERENQRLKSEQDANNAKLAAMPALAKRIQQQVPVPQFTGVQQIVGVEGMPGAPPTSQPDAQSTTMPAR
jgi:hypothetical protein